MCRTHFTDGYAYGLVKTQLPRKNGTTYIEYIPLDYEQGENKKLPKMQSLIVKNEFIKRLSMGDPSSRRQIMKFVPRSPADLPEAIRDTEEGRWMTKAGQLAHIQKIFGKAIISGDEAIADAMSDYARGQISKNVLQQIKEVNQKYREMQSKPIEEQK